MATPALDEEQRIPWPTDASNYTIRGLLGTGAFARVYLAECLVEYRDDDNKVIRTEHRPTAVKVLDLDELDNKTSDLQSEVSKEITMLSQMRHENLVRSYCSFVADSDLWLVMPLLGGGSCSDMMRRFWPNGFKDEALLATLLQSTLRGLAYLHKQGRVHRDIKAGNILVSDEGNVLIGDFGVVGTLLESGRRRQQCRTFTGTPCWMAPEVVEQSRGYNARADIWSFGITALELAFGRPPYARHRPMKVMLMILQSDPPSCDSFDDKSHQFSRQFRDLVCKCLQKDPAKRPTAEKLLKHSFFKKARGPAFVVESVISHLPPIAQRFAPIGTNKDGEPTFELPKSKLPAPERARRTKDRPTTVRSWVFDDIADLKRQAEQEEASRERKSATPGSPSPTPSTRGTRFGRFEVQPDLYGTRRSPRPSAAPSGAQSGAASSSASVSTSTSASGGGRSGAASAPRRRGRFEEVPSTKTTRRKSTTAELSRSALHRQQPPPASQPVGGRRARTRGFSLGRAAPASHKSSASSSRAPQRRTGRFEVMH
ncbi:MAG: hypothetical protein MHM6MM_004131 [Cercozoa sp. M6MM]